MSCLEMNALVTQAGSSGRNGLQRVAAANPLEQVQLVGGGQQQLERGVLRDCFSMAAKRFAEMSCMAGWR